jgi:hypothetical protein
MAAIAALEGECQRAARLFGAGEILREAVGASVLPAYRPDHERGLVALRSALGEADIQGAWVRTSSAPQEAIKRRASSIAIDG